MKKPTPPPIPEGGVGKLLIFKFLHACALPRNFGKIGELSIYIF